MKKFTCVQDIGNLKAALDEAFEIKKDRFKYVELGRNKTLMMIFFNSSLRTRLSTQKAATNLGMNVIVLDINQGRNAVSSWMETNPNIYWRLFL
jgi:N-succinyl-L-ornithine transcarbamylase